MATLKEDSHSYLLDRVGPPDAEIAALEKILSSKRYRRRRGAPGWAMMGALAASLLVGTALAFFAIPKPTTTLQSPVEDAMAEVDAPPPATSAQQSPVAHEEVVPKIHPPVEDVSPGAAEGHSSIVIGPTVDLPGTTVPGEEETVSEITAQMR